MTRDQAIEILRKILAQHDEDFPTIGDEWTMALPAGIVRAVVFGKNAPDRMVPKSIADALRDGVHIAQIYPHEEGKRKGGTNATQE